MTQPLLEARKVTVTYRTRSEFFNAVDSASLQVQSREAIGIVGESGSGKTTLARVLVGLLRPASGEVLLRGVSTSSPNGRNLLPRAVRASVQMVFQDPYSSLNPRQRAWSAVAEAIHVRQGFDGGHSKRAAFELLDSVGIGTQSAKQLPKSLSGGQRQRVSVARALAANPDVLVADEPTSSIDQSAQAQLLDLLKRLQLQRNLAIVFVSHDLSIVRYLCDRVYVMREGQIVEEGVTTEVFRSPSHPYTRKLIDSIPGRRT